MNRTGLASSTVSWWEKPWLVLMFYMLLVLACLPVVRQVEKDFSTQRFVPDDDPDLAYNREIVGEFGGDELIVIGIEAPDIFTKETLQVVENLTMTMESGPGVTRVVSLATVNKLEGDAGYLDSDLLMPYIPEDASETEALKEVSTSNPIFRNEVVSADGTATAINVFVDPDLLEGDTVRAVTSFVDNAIATARQDLPAGADIYAVGTPQMIEAFRVSMEADLKWLVPIAVALIAMILLLIFRSVIFAMVPILTGCASVLPTVAFMSLAGYAMDPITSIVPLLILVIGSTEDTHLLAEYRRFRAAGLSCDEAIRRMFEQAGTAILLTSFTTALGFASLTLSQIPALRDFGIVSAFGILLNLVITVHLLPAVLRSFPNRWISPVKGGKDSGARHTGNRISQYTQRISIRNRWVVIAIGVGAIGFFLVGTQRVHINTDFIRVLHPENPVRVAFDRLGSSLSGGNFFRVVVEAPGPDDMLRSTYLKQLDKVDQYLATRFDKTLSLSQFIRKIHVEMNDGNPEFDQIPEDDELIAQYTLLLDQSDLTRVLDFDHRRASIIVRSSAGSSSYLGAEAEALEAFVEQEISPLVKVRMTGRLLQMAHSADKISSGIGLNIGIMLSVIVITISLLFMSVKAGLISLVPNVLPVLAVFGVMGWLNMPLSIFTFSVAVIGLGIAVDDTIHFLSRYHHQLRKSQTPEEAMEGTIAAEFLPISSTSLALTAGFLILTGSSFATTVEFGFLSAVSIFTAFLGDMFFAPSLLLRTPIVSSWAFLRMKFNVERAQDRGLFLGMGRNDIRRVAIMGQIQEFTAGARVLRKGDKGRDIFLILEGEVDVFIEEDVSDKPVATYREGDCIGEMAFLMDSPRSANVVARGPLRLLRIDDSTLRRVEGHFPRTATKVYRNIAQMLVKRLKQRTEWGLTRQPFPTSKPNSENSVEEEPDKQR